MQILPPKGSRRVAAIALFAVSVLHLPIIYRLLRDSGDAPPYTLVPLTVLAMGAAWGSGLLVENRITPLPFAAALLTLAELPFVLLTGTVDAARFHPPLLWYGAIFCGSLVALSALVGARRAAARRAAGAPPDQTR